jgi:hypothetical protein
MNNTGESFPIEDDNMILQIDSPKDSLSGLYAVVFKNLEERWAIVAFDWDGQPRLGIRWFWGGGGNPFSSGRGSWLVVPPSLSRSMLSGLPLDHAFSRRLDDFLSGVIPGNQLRG